MFWEEGSWDRNYISSDGDLKDLRGCPGGPVVKTLGVHCRPRRFSVWSGNLEKIAHAVADSCCCTTETNTIL